MDIFGKVKCTGNRSDVEEIVKKGRGKDARTLFEKKPWVLIEVEMDDCLIGRDSAGEPYLTGEERWPSSVKGKGFGGRRLLFGFFLSAFFFQGLGGFLFGFFAGVLTFSHRNAPL